MGGIPEEYRGTISLWVGGELGIPGAVLVDG